MNTSESIKELATALAKAQAILTTAKKDVTNPHFNKKYADLASCWEAIKAAMPQHGLSVIQTTTPSEKDEVVVTTRLMHSSGEWIEGSLALPVSRADAQGYGSALTYARRYGLCAITGVAPEEDDGNLAAAAKPEVRPISGKQLTVEALESMPAEEQLFIKERAMELLAIFEDKGDMAGWIERQHLDTEQKMALWSLLPSNVRSEIKRQQADKRKAA